MAKKNMSAFNMGIVAAKKGNVENPFEETSMKHEWFNDGVLAASSPKYATKEGVLLKDKPLYEE